jgi:hypothetical protein
MKQYEAVIKTMEDNGGYATLGYLNQYVLKINNCDWKTKTPFASIRRIVQDSRYFFKIRPGLWALNSHKESLPPEIYSEKEPPKEKKEEYTHTYYQGLLVEIGNFKKYKTFVPNQDKNRVFLGKRLSELISIADIYQFSYDHIVRTSQTVDVLWFNERKMPASVFEIEHSTNITTSLLKFIELQDFNVDFHVVADKVRKREYESKIALNAFSPIINRTRFWSYDNVVELHSKTSELISIETTMYT